MDRRERGGDLQTGLLAALTGHQATMWTALPGIIQSFDPTKRTAVIQAALQAQVQAPDGSYSWVTLPPLLDCPVFFPGGGGCTLTFPIAFGDECLMIFASRCIDQWWQSGCPLDANGKPTSQIQAEFRMHDLSDGFAYVGVSSLPKVIPNISTTKTQLRNDLGTTFIELDPAAGAVAIHTVGNLVGQVGGNLTATAGGSASVSAIGPMTLAAPTINLTATTLNLSGSLNINGAAYLSHAHFDPQGGNTGGVV